MQQQKGTSAARLWLCVGLATSFELDSFFCPSPMSAANFLAQDAVSQPPVASPSPWSESTNTSSTQQTLVVRAEEVPRAYGVMSVIFPHERLKFGAEMQLAGFTAKDSRSMNSYRFIIGRTGALKPSANTRVDLFPLIGATHEAPRLSVFAVFFYVFGGNEAEAPASTRNR